MGILGDYGRTPVGTSAIDTLKARVRVFDAVITNGYGRIADYTAHIEECRAEIADASADRTAFVNAISTLEGRSDALEAKRRTESPHQEGQHAGQAPAVGFDRELRLGR